MTEATPDLYTGLDQIIAKPTKPATAPEAKPETAENVAGGLDAAEESNGKKKTTEQPQTEVGTALVRRLDPDPPEALELYRKQTLQFGPKELDTIQRIQQVMSNKHHRETTKNDLVRAAVEFLAKDFDAHSDDSFLVRKFVRR